MLCSNLLWSRKTHPNGHDMLQMKKRSRVTTSKDKKKDSNQVTRDLMQIHFQFKLPNAQASLSPSLIPEVQSSSAVYSSLQGS